MPRRRLPDSPVPVDTGSVEFVRTPGCPDEVTVLVNGVESSYVDFADPSRLEFEYMQHMMVVLDALGPARPSPLRAVHLGAAACSLASAIEAVRPGSRQIAVEVDATLARLVREWFDLPRSPRLRIRAEDARAAVADLPAGSQDAVLRDAFSRDAVPSHLRTAEFLGQASRALRPAGAYLANCADVPPLRDTRREVATAVAVFPHVGLISEPAVLKGRRYGNLVLVGSHTALPVDRISRALRALPQPATLLADREAVSFAGSARPFYDPTPGHEHGRGMTTNRSPSRTGTTKGSHPLGASPS